MKKYETPTIEIYKFNGENIITASSLLSQWIGDNPSNSIAVELNDTELYMAYDE
ncbi:MAG: hypothetical protein IJT23_11070 [Clostridia bacterium]|nr:hypothetical protein [Clostridia bacterium]